MRDIADFSNVSNDTQDKFYDELHEQKYRDKGDTRQDHSHKLAAALASNSEHYSLLFNCFNFKRFLPAGRVQAALGSSRESSPFNCAVSGAIPDDMAGIMDRLKEGALTLRLGTGIGYDFSTLRPRGSSISTLKSEASGPISFAQMFDGMAKTIHMSHRRGAQMGMLNVHHPDILDFIGAKMRDGFTTFNFSVAVTDEFMNALEADGELILRFPIEPGGSEYKRLKARNVWDLIMRCAYDSAEPGIIYIDRVNSGNNLWYCEDIRATNPCAEQPLPPYGMCLLGSFNLTQYIRYDPVTKGMKFRYDWFKYDIRRIVEAYDNIFDKAIYALPQHRDEALNKRRMGLGLTGIANALEIMGHRYGEDSFIEELDKIAHTLNVTAYETSVDLARERGAFPLFDKNKYTQAPHIKALPERLQENIYKYGIRNSHLISYAPCGTISLVAGNVSSGVEPVFYYEAQRKVLLNDSKNPVTVNLQDYAYRQYGVKGKTLEECSIKDHLRVLAVTQRHCDSSISKTINVPRKTSFEDYKDVYRQAYSLGAKGLTVYRPNDIRGPVISSGDCKDGECKL